MKLKIAFCFFAMILAAFSVYAQSPQISINDVISQLAWKDFKANMSLSVSRGASEPLEKKIEVNLRHHDGGQDLFILFNYPTNMRGMAFLALNRANMDDEWYMYVRTIRQVKRVPTNSENFMLRDFLSLYLLKPRTELWNFSALPKNDQDAYLRIEGTAKNDDVTSLTGYAKIVHFIDVANKTIVKTEFYNEKNEVIRVQNVTRFEKIGSVMLPVEFDVDDKQEDVKARVKLTNIRLDTGLSPELFTVRYLKTL